MRRAVLALLLLLLAPMAARAQGVLEFSNSTTTRARLTAAEITALIPSARGQFTMPAPWGTTAWRITIPSDCASTACVSHSAYSYWAQLNNSAGSDTLYIMVVLYDGGAETYGGPTLYSLTKSSGVITKIGPIFNVGQGRSQGGEGFFFSGTLPTRMYYVFSSATDLGYVDVLTHVKTSVFDISTQTGLYGSAKYLWQAHASHDDNVFSFTVRDDGNYYGCGTYKVSTNTYKYFPWLGHDYDECQIDQSGEYLLIKEQITMGGPNPADRVIRLSDDREVQRNTNNGGGHSDMGYRVAVMGDDALSYPAAELLDLTGATLPNGTVVYHDVDFNNSSLGHISFLNALDAPTSNQYAIGSNAFFTNGPRVNELTAFKLDGSLTTLSVAPNLILQDSLCTIADGYNCVYTQDAFANVDPTGRYIFWTANMGVDGGRLDAFLVYIPQVSGFGSSGPVRLRRR